MDEYFTTERVPGQEEPEYVPATPEMPQDARMVKRMPVPLPPKENATKKAQGALNTKNNNVVLSLTPELSEKLDRVARRRLTRRGEALRQLIAEAQD